jgi:hypothetical protein
VGVRDLDGGKVALVNYEGVGSIGWRMCVRRLCYVHV